MCPPHWEKWGDGPQFNACLSILKDDVLAGAILIYRQEVRPFTNKQIEVVGGGHPEWTFFLVGPKDCKGDSSNGAATVNGRRFLRQLHATAVVV